MKKGEKVRTQRLELELRAVAVRLLRQIRDAGDDSTLSPSQASALTRLNAGGITTASELAVVENVRPQSMSAIVDALESMKLITRTRDEGDGRRQILELTDAGRTQIEGGQESGKAWLEQALARLSASELQTLSVAISILQRLLDTRATAEYDPRPPRTIADLTRRQPGPRAGRRHLQ